MFAREIHLAEGVPETEFSFTFAQRMADAMSVSYFKYGAIADAYPNKVDAIASLKRRLDLYELGGYVKDVWIPAGNPDYLIDVANFAMIEHTHPKLTQLIDADKTERASPGRSRLDGAEREADNQGRKQEERAVSYWPPLLSDQYYKHRGD